MWDNEAEISRTVNIGVKLPSHPIRIEGNTERLRFTCAVTHTHTHSLPRTRSILCDVLPGSLYVSAALRPEAVPILDVLHSVCVSVCACYSVSVCVCYYMYVCVCHCVCAFLNFTVIVNPLIKTMFFFCFYGFCWGLVYSLCVCVCSPIVVRTFWAFRGLRVQTSG